MANEQTRPEPTEYNAKGEYLRTTSFNAPSNIPMAVYKQAQGAIINEMMGSPTVRRQQATQFSPKIARWGAYTREQRFSYVSQMTDPDELKMAMYAQMDIPMENDLLEFMVTKKQELEQQGAPPPPEE